MEETNRCSVIGCAREAKPEYVTQDIDITLCRDHVWDLFAHQAEKAREAVAEIEGQGLLLGPTKGWTYVIRMDNGNVKMGKGGTGKKSLSERLQDISNGLQESKGVPVQVLAVLQGGTSTELLAHNQWLHLRVSGRMEQFYADPSLLKWAEEQGIHPDAEAEIEAFQGWQERKHLDPKRSGAAGQAKRLGTTLKLTGELAMDPRGKEETEEEEVDW
ncbi:hypothetical protein [Streptomyces sp. NPDC001108]